MLTKRCLQLGESDKCFDFSTTNDYKSYVLFFTYKIGT